MSETTIAPAATSVTPPVGIAVSPDIAAFIYVEARLADEARYSEWESLWADDALYWVPMRPNSDPNVDVSYIYDNRRRLKSRVAQLNSGSRHSQTPPSVLRRTVANLEVLATDDDTVTVGSNFSLYEYRYGLTIWAGRYVHRIRTSGERPVLVSKTVHLVNAGGPVQTMSFLI